MARHIRVGGVMLTVAVLGMPACHLFEDPDTLDECPLNSGYPCPCNPQINGAQCDDGSTCEFFDDPGEGVCAATCRGIEDRSSCRASRWDGEDGYCRLKANGAGMPNRCLAACWDETDCPPGMSCVFRQDDYGPFMACYPLEGIGTSPCERFCTKRFDCNGGPLDSITAEECIRSCETGNWDNDSCGSCWLACDVTSACDVFGECLGACDCIG